ncbi:MAG: histone deacetylase family protein [Solirubrobacterales bacterium]
MALYVSHPSSHLHDTGPHPENAGRLVAIEAAMEAREWLGVERASAPAAPREWIERVHAPEHVDAIEKFTRGGGGMIDHDTVASAESFEAALRAAGGAAWAVERLLAGEHRAAFCGLRPPGHHAERARAMGFCLFNNVAVASAHAIAECEARRVLVLDWDVHHGNGTEEIFAASGDVVYVSIHQAPLYPGTGDASFTGVGEGEGRTVNLPVPPGAGPDDFLALVQHVVAPLAREFRPGLLAISAGYDAHRADPLASCRLDEDAFADMTAAMRELGAELEAPVLGCLEGGYDPPALAASVLATIEALDSERPVRDVDVGTAEPHRRRVAAAWPALASNAG